MTQTLSDPDDDLTTAAAQTLSIAEPTPATSPEDEARVGVYGLIAGLLASSPDAGSLARVAALPAGSDRAAFGLAWDALRLAAVHVSPSQADDEYHRLFIGLGRGELVPYGSWYRTGYLMELPLGELRRDLAALGFEREANNSEPEDHAAALCEVMGALAADPDVSIPEQRRFYDDHLAPWIGRFASDLAGAEAAPFYGAVGRLAEAFFAIERLYLEMEER